MGRHGVDGAGHEPVTVKHRLQGTDEGMASVHVMM